MDLITLLILVILVCALVGVFPRWPHSTSWGYGPSAVIGVLLVVLLILALTGRFHLVR